ncbi:hypothetical protein [Pseudoduganella violacea]|uniref:Uncharacterized protein n=1 Tax=Pseudoduganella violacea TaxID=1715466 RepID=A0A7W5FWH5_9BURK|nr:hypothetical protein [Pseudoduganella violacea]MBB3121283.1 hypothetical protein [Pseudoduganella violacea]
MIDKHVVKVIVDFAIFLEFADQDTVDADAAMAALEQLSAELQKAPDNVKADLTKSFHDISHEYGPRAGFVTDLAPILGLVE